MTNTTQSNDRIDYLLTGFAIDIHGAKPGEDETRYFDHARQAIEQLLLEARLEELQSPSISFSKELRRMKHHFDIGNLTEKGMGSYEELLGFETNRMRRISQIELELNQTKEK